MYLCSYQCAVQLIIPPQFHNFLHVHEKKPYKGTSFEAKRPLENQVTGQVLFMQGIKINTYACNFEGNES